MRSTRGGHTCLPLRVLRRAAFRFCCCCRPLRCRCPTMILAGGAPPRIVTVARINIVKSLQRILHSLPVLSGSNKPHVTHGPRFVTHGGILPRKVAETQHALSQQREAPSSMVLAMFLSFLNSPKGDPIDANGDGSMLSAVPPSDDIPGPHNLSGINSPPKPHTRRPLEAHSTATAGTAEKNDVGPRTLAATDYLSMSRWTGRAPSRTRPRWTLSRSLVQGPAAGWRVTPDGPEWWWGWARDAYCARGSLALWAVRAT